MNAAISELADVRGPDGVVDMRQLRSGYGRFPTGVTALAALSDGVPVGFAASSFNTVSADPPLVSVCVQSGSATWPKLEASARIGVSVLADTQGPLCRQLAGRGDRFAGVSVTHTDGGALLVDGAAAWLECTVEQVFPIGDHEVVILRVHRLGVDSGKQPLVFGDSRFHELRELRTPLPIGSADWIRELATGWW